MSDKFRTKKEPKHVRLYSSITGCEAWKHLSGNSVKVLLALCARDNGTRNGAISFSVREAADTASVSIPTAKRCLDELQEKGFISCTQKGAFSRKVSHASLWRYTWAAWPGGSPSHPTRDFEKWTPDGNMRCKKFPVTVQVSSLEAETRHGPVQEIDTEALETPLISVGGAPKETCTHNSYQEDGLGTLRDSVLTHLGSSDAGEQTRLADSIRIPPGTLSKFIHGKNLPEQYRARLENAVVSRHIQHWS